MTHINVFRMKNNLLDQLNQFVYMCYLEQVKEEQCYVEEPELIILEKIFSLKLARVTKQLLLEREIVYHNETRATKEQFQMVKEQIKNRLVFPPVKSTMEADTINRLYYGLILSLVDSVGVHINKGEFIKKEDKIFFERYRKAILGRPMNEDTTYFIFSDDTEWCKKHELKLGLGEVNGDVIYVEENHSREKEYIDMQLLGCCKTVIASNGDFVKWALRLAKQENIQKIDINQVEVDELAREEQSSQLTEQRTLEGKEVILEYMNEIHAMLTVCLENFTDKFEAQIDAPRIAVMFQEMKNFDQIHKAVLKMPSFWKQIASVEASLDNIRHLYLEKRDYAYSKLRYECIPMLEEMRMQFFYHAWIKDRNNKGQTDYSKIDNLFHNPYIEQAKKTGEYKYDLTVVVLAYNELYYTKQCLEYLLKNIPPNIKYELILLNHGSSDGTKEYFETLHPDKQIDIAVNGGGANLVARIVEGRYWLGVTNDVLVMPYAIENMYKCIQSDAQIVSVVATTPNIGNQQSVALEEDYSDLDKMESLARENNVSDPKRWEEKVRLFNPINLLNTALHLECLFDKDNIFGYVDFGWPDHKQAMLYRQKGYKSVLAKDAYCYHYGQVTLKKERKSEENAQKIFRKTRIKWLKEWHYDPSGYGQIWDEALFDKLVISDSTTYNILGINSGMGENLLKFKNLIRENGNDMSSIWLSSVTQFKMNIPDLQNLTNEMIYDPQLKCFDREAKRKYDYILFENVAEDFDISILEKIDKWKKKEGRLLLRVNEDMQLRDLLMERYGAKPFAEGKLGLWVSIFD